MANNIQPIHANDSWIVDSDNKVVGVQTKNTAATFGNVTATTNPVTGGSKISGLGVNNFELPRILIVGDSTVVYAYATSAAPTSAYGDVNGTVTVQFSSSQALQVGDRLGFIEITNACKFCATESVVSAVTGSGPYFYTFSPDQTPVVGTHPSPANLSIVFLEKESSGGFATEFKTLLGAGFEIVVAGNGGDDIYDITSRLPTLLARFAPTRVILTHGINDCYRTGRTVVDVIAQYPIINKLICDAGAVLEIVGPPPQPSTRASWTTTTRDWMRDLRKSQAMWCGAAQIDYTDWWATAAGTTQAVSPTDVNANPSTNVIGTDLVHPALAGNYLVAKKLAAKYRARYPQAESPLAQSVIDGGIITNPFFTGTGGTRTAGTGTVAAGNVADTYDVTVTAGTATVTPYQTARTIAADGDVCGNWQGASMVAVAAGDSAVIRSPALHSVVENGKNYRLTCQVKLKTGFDICKTLSLGVTSQTSITGNVVYLLRSTISSNESPHPESAIFTFDKIIGVRGPLEVHGAPTLFRPGIQCVAAASGTIQFEVSRMSIVEV